MKHVQIELKVYLTLTNGEICQDGIFREYSETELLNVAKKVIQRVAPFCDVVRPVGINFTGVER